MILTVEERHLGPVLEPHHELTSAAAIPETPNASQVAQPQAPETGIALMGDAVDAVQRENLDGADGPGANGGDQVGAIGAVTGSADAPANDLAAPASSSAEQPAVVEAPDKTAKPKPAKHKDDSK